MSGCIVYFRCKPVVPIVLLDHVIVYLRVQLVQMVPEVLGSGACLVEIIGDRPWDLLLIKTMVFAAGLLEGGVSQLETSKPYSPA